MAELGMQKHLNWPWLVVAIMACLAVPLSAQEQRDTPQPTAGESYWLGIGCVPADDALRAQLKLTERQGLIISVVAPESPGANGGLQPFDVIVAVNNQPMREVADLVTAVAAAKDTKLTLHFYREGEKRSLDMAPARRPAQFVSQTSAGHLASPAGLSPALILEQDRQALLRWLDNQQAAQGASLQLRLMHPAVVISDASQPSQATKLPADMSITISWQGDQSAKISVKLGDQHWEAEEGRLDQLPDHIRPLVSGFIPNNAPSSIKLQLPQETASREAAQPLPDTVQKQLQDLQKRLEALERRHEESSK